MCQNQGEAELPTGFGTRPRSSLRSGSAHSKQRSVTFADENESLSDTILNEEQTYVLQSMKNMMEGEYQGVLSKSQRKALSAVRAALLQNDVSLPTPMVTPSQDLSDMDYQNRSLIIYTLASHISHQSVTMGVEPSSLFYSIADLMNLTTHLLNDLEREKSDAGMMFVLPETPCPTTGLKKIHQEVGCC